MANFLKIFQLIPTIIAVVQALEQAIPLPGQGKAKLDAVLAMIQQIDGPLATGILPAVTGIISTIVGAFNATGVFKTSTSTK